MNVLIGIKNFLNFINENWTMIASIITVGIVVVKKIKTYFNLSKEEQVDIVKAQIAEVMLKLVTEAECDYQSWIKAGSIKRSQVIDEIFMMYPVLSEITNQKEIIIYIDNMIDEALEEMRKIFEENKDKIESASIESA